MRLKPPRHADDPDARLTMVLLRHIAGLRQGAFAEATGIAASQISDYEQGYRVLPRKHLERMADAVGFPRPLLGPLLQVLRFFRLAIQGRMGVGRLLQASIFSSKLLALSDEVTELIAPEDVSPAALTPPRPEDRLEAEALWRRLEARTPAQRLAVIEELPEARTWALVERIAAASIEAAGNEPRDALRLASLAVQVAELMPGTPEERSRALGYALAHLANAERVCGDLPTAGRTLSRARLLWEQGAPGDSGLLNGVWIIWIEATLLHIQERPAEALARIEEALAQNGGELRPRLLYTKSRCVEALGRTEESTALLREAEVLVDLSKEPRLALGIKIQLLVNICAEGRAREAEPDLPEVRQLAEGLGRTADFIRVLWIEGRVAAALRRTEEARERLNQVRRYFEEQGIPYDYAVASLELSLVYLRTGRTAEVRVLASELLWIFHHQDLPANALGAIRVFYEAARLEEVSTALVERVLDFLKRALRAPEAVFMREEGEAR